jgi:Core-2/I-Branching enzyme
MKIAYIVLAYKNPDQLGRLIRKLINKNSTFYLHIDKKSNISDFKSELSNLNNSTKINLLPRINSYWGGPGLVNAILHGLDKTLNDGDINRIVLISGQDYPIKSMKYIFDFFENNKEKNFLPYFKLPSDIWGGGGMSRIHNYHFRIFGKTYTYPPLSPPIHFYSKIFYKILKIRFQKPREFPVDLQPYGGFSGWKITAEAAKEIMSFVDKRPDYLKYHKYTKCSDEIFFQSILLNSKNDALLNSFINDDLTYIKWKQNMPNPEILKTSDFEAIKKTEALFARKFDPLIDSEILDMIDKQILVP